MMLRGLAALLSSAACLADVTVDLGTARLALDDMARVRSLRTTDGKELSTPGVPALLIVSDGARRLPTRLTGTDEGFLVAFDGGATARFAVRTQPGMALFELKELRGAASVDALRLFSLPVPRDAKVASIINAAYVGEHMAAVMAAEPNVRAFSTRFAGHRSDKAQCSHAFVQVTDTTKVGRAAARFSATSRRDDKAGWSVRSRRFDKPLDLTGCKALRVWVHGDGKGEHLKIQLQDGQGGYRDNYIPIDFKGWRHLMLTNCPINTLRYDQVRTIAFYYNSLPAQTSVTCLIDHVEAVLVRDGKEHAVVLEGFERSDSPLWNDVPVTLNAQTYRAYRLEPARFGLLVCDKDDFSKTAERFEAMAGLPSPHPGGAWSKTSPWTKRSYLFITRFSRPQTDRVLELARRGGFHTILILGGSWHESTGHYRVNRRNFPDGLPGLKQTVQRFKDGGFKVGLHFLGASIRRPDPYLTPVPDKRLVKGASAELAADVDAETDVIPTATAPSGFPAEDGGYRGKGTVLWIGDELIHYAERSMEPPYGFRGCRRGHLGTRPSAHPKGAPIRHLVRAYGYHMHDMDTSLLDEVADHFARVANACNVDMLYFDGSERLQGDHWYYNARLHKAFYDRLDNKNAFLQASSFSHYSWHLMSRSASADGHGDLKGYLEARSPWFDTLADNVMPLDIGWYYGYDPSATPDMFEYVLAATIHYDCSMSFQVSVAAADRHPFSGVILDMIARYEKLRLSGRVPEAIRRRLGIVPELAGQMEPEERAARLSKRREYRLLGPPGEEVFQRVVYAPWTTIATVAERDRTVDATITDGPARVGAHLHAMSGPWPEPEPSYRSPDAVILEDFDDLAGYLRGSKPTEPVHAIGHGQGGQTLDGVTQRLESIEQGARQGRRCGLYTATSKRPTADGWSVIGKTFDPPLDLSWHKGIGLMMRGDGKGGKFKVQIRDTGKGVQDYYIGNDDVGWRYHRLTRPAEDRLDYARVARLLLYYNGLPARSTVSCGLDDIKALRGLSERTIRDPSVVIGGKRLTWRGELSVGHYLFFEPKGVVTHYGPGLGDGRRLADTEPVVLPAGHHRAAFGCDGAQPMPVRLRVVHYPPERHAIP